MKIALDVMGGDFAPQNPMGGVKLALESLPIDKIYLVGQPEAIEREMKAQGIPASDKLEIVSAMQIVDMHDSGLDAVRKKKDSSISVAVDLVKDGKADAVVSAGHTGAAVTASEPGPVVSGPGGRGVRQLNLKCRPASVIVS
jgi:glycerol-3-phosphate acyltransferase PlsX